MLQEYPTQIQPKSSSTRGTQDSLQQESDTSTNKVDAEASRILIDLANQGTNDNTHNVIMSNKIHNKAKVKKHSYQLQSDPIMLLAAAAAVIDKESNNKDDYKGGSRVYERREIQLNSRQQGSLKRKSYTYGVNSNSKSSLFQHRRHSEKRHYYQRGSISTQDNTWSPLRKDEEVVVVEGAKGSSHNKTTTTFSWQFLSMKQNPRIKRNAMHAYITYMIYTDMAQEQQRRSMKVEENTIYNTPSSDWLNNNSSITMQSYRLPPSPRQKRHDSPPTESIMGRPLTDFLFERNNTRSKTILPLPQQQQQQQQQQTTTASFF